jgi:hypothetical protein
MGLFDFIKELFMVDNERVRKLNDNKKNDDIDRDIAGLTSAMYLDHKLNDDKLFKKANVFSVFDHSNKSAHNQNYEPDNDYYYDDYCDYDDDFND